jgi:hypothetical protein
MASELNVLGHRLNRISEKHRSSRDFTRRSLTRALREIIACFPVYRTYLGDGGGEGARERDREIVVRAVALAKGRTPASDASVYDWIQDVLTLRFPEWAGEADRAERTDFVMRFQQITGPVMAKGYEDTSSRRSRPRGGRGWPGGGGSTRSTGRWWTAGRSPVRTRSTSSTRPWSAPGPSTGRGSPRTASRPSPRPRSTRAGSTRAPGITRRWRGSSRPCSTRAAPRRSTTTSGPSSGSSPATAPSTRSPRW